MARNTTPDYLLLDREDPDNPRLVIARGLWSVPVEVTDDLDASGYTWLRVLDWDRLDWLRDILDADVGVQMTRPGREGFATRLRRWREIPPDGEHRDDGWFDGWTDTRLEHHTGQFTDAPDIEPFDDWASPWDNDDELTVHTHNHD